MTDTQISEDRIERAAIALWIDEGVRAWPRSLQRTVALWHDNSDETRSMRRRMARTALETDAPALEAARAEGLREARKIASGLFGWDVDTWRDMTKKDMTRLMAEAIVAAIDARLSEMDRKPVNEGG